jgi:hypothetical protein
VKSFDYPILLIASPLFHSNGFLVRCRGRMGMSAMSMIFSANAAASSKSIHSNGGGVEVDEGAIE